jgi:hypothetical protein
MGKRLARWVRQKRVHKLHILQSLLMLTLRLELRHLRDFIEY